MNAIHKVVLDRKARSAYVHLSVPKKGASHRQVNLEDAVIVDIGVDGDIIGIEILHVGLLQLFFNPKALAKLEEAKIPVMTTD